MNVKRETLLAIACLVWCAAGFNILRIGIEAYPLHLTVLNLALSCAVFAVFQKFVFGRLVGKHTARIGGYGDERQFFLKSAAPVARQGRTRGPAARRMPSGPSRDPPALFTLP